MPIIRDEESKKLDISILGGNSGRAVAGNPITKWHVLEDRTIQQFRTEYWGPTIFSEKLISRVEQRDYRLDMGEVVKFKGAHPGYCGDWGFVETEEELRQLILTDENGVGNRTLGLSSLPQDIFDNIMTPVPNMWKEIKTKNRLGTIKTLAEKPLEEGASKNNDRYMTRSPENRVALTNNSATLYNDFIVIAKNDNLQVFDDMS